jgi:Zn-dependent peptidase ImmA (M78 family)
MAVDKSLLSPAERLLWSYGCRDPEHIDLEAIACDKGARVVYRCMDGCAARLLTDGRTAVISIDSRDNEGRQRFSLGHELAHWINDSRKGFNCTGDVIGPQNAEAVSVEANANAYASQLVLPDYMVSPWMEGRKFTLNVAVDLAETFHSSVTAAAIKLAKRSTSPVCVVCHNMHGRRWFVRSRPWPLDLYPVTQLHQNTAAFDIAFKATSRMSTPRKDQADWWLSGPDVWRAHVETQSMKLPDGSALTTLAFQPARH